MVFFSGQIRKGEYVYLHKLPFKGPDGKPQFVQGGNSREFHSIPGVEGIKPIEIKEIPVNKYLNLIRKATPADLKLRKKYMKKQGVAEGLENNNTTAQKIFFARSDKAPKGWSYDHVGFITQDGRQIQMSGHKGNDVYVTNDVTDDPEFPKQNIKIVSLSKPVSVPLTNSVGAENCGTFVANVLQANGIKGIDTQKIYSVFKQPQKQGVAEGIKFRSKQECIDHFVRTGRSAAQGAAAWERMSSQLPVPKAVKPYDPKQHGKHWWQKDESVTEMGGVGVVRGGNDPRYSMSTAGDQNDVTGNTLGQEMRALGLVGRKNPGINSVQRPVKRSVGRGN
jgi:hypothetical protein